MGVEVGGVKVSQSGNRCQTVGCREEANLWLNLTDGSIHCGQAQADGLSPSSPSHLGVLGRAGEGDRSGGAGHAKAHFVAGGRKAPLVVKLGTVCKAGADVVSYAEGDNLVGASPFRSLPFAPSLFSLLLAPVQ